MRLSLSDAGTAVLAVCALTITGLVVRRELRPAAERAAAPPARVAEWRAVGRTGHRTGPPSAPVVIVEFSDFECPYCAAAQPLVRRLAARYPRQVAVVYRHFPLDAIHPHARAAAAAAECAGEQGRFDAYADSLFARQKQLGAFSWTALAHAVGVRDTAAYARCLGAPATADRVASDLAAGRSLGIPGTPSFLVNDRLLPGAQSFEALDSAVTAALAPPR
jgi:NhaA family Na+:H+ antiporter